MEASIQHTSTSTKLKNIATIGIPAVIESIIAVVIGTIDTKMISGLGKGAVSAVSFTSQPKLIILSIFFAMGTAVSVFVAQALGRKDRDEANAYFQTIFRLTVILSLILGIACGVLAGPIMSICNRQHMLRTSPGLRSLLMKFWKYGSPYLPVTEKSSFALSLVQSKSGVML